MIKEVKTLEYYGRVVFKKITMSYFKRFQRDYSANEACFAFVVTGGCTVRDQTQTLTINQSTALLAKCTNYFYESPVHTFADETDDTINQVIGVFLYPEIYQRLFDFDINKSTHTVDYNLKQIEVDKLLAHYRDSIDILLESPELADELLIENKLREFVILMTKTVDAPSELDFLASMFKPHFAQFEEVIQSNLYADLNMQELAALCHMSLSTFRRKFKKTYSESPIKYVTRLKVDKAVSLLKTELRISEIVFQTGFESVSTFNRAFKAHTGKSPSEFRLSYPR